MLNSVLDEAMSYFDERSERDAFSEKLNEIAERYNDHFSMIGANVLYAYEALGLTQNNVTSWTDGPFSIISETGPRLI